MGTNIRQEYIKKNVSLIIFTLLLLYNAKFGWFIVYSTGQFIKLYKIM